MRDRRLLQLLLVSSSSTWLCCVAAWSSITAFTKRTTTGPPHNIVNTNPNNNKRQQIPPTHTNNNGWGLAYQVGETYEDSSSWEEDADINSDIIINEKDNNDYSGNTFGDVLQQLDDDDDDDTLHHDVFQLDGPLASSTTTTTTTTITPEGTIDLEDDDDGLDYSYSLASDYVLREDHDAAQTIFPCLDHWYVLEEEDNDGTLSIAGIVSNHPRYPCGHAVITSSLEQEWPSQLYGQLEAESMVTTVTGSQYLLGLERLALQLDDWVVVIMKDDDDDDDEAQPRILITGTVRVIPPPTTNQDSTTDTAHVVERLGALLAHVGQEITIPLSQQQQHEDGCLQEAKTVTTALGQPYRLGSPKLTTITTLAPLLQQWKRLEGGSIAGYVEQHPTIPDGELVTTSPLVELDESHDGLVLVTTESGSQYRLGEAEPTKEQRWQQQQAQDEEELNDEDEEEFLMEMEDEEEEEIDIPTMHVPETHNHDADPASVLSGLFSSFLPHIHDNSHHQQHAQPPPLELELESQVASQQNTVLNNTDGDEGRGWDPLLP